MKKILIIDDDPGIRMLYTEEFIEVGYDVVAYGGGKGLMNVIMMERPDLVVLDVGLGEGSGLDILQDIRRTYNLPIILCTAHHSFTYDLKSLAADYCVLKSSDLTELKLKVRMAFEGMRRFNSTGMPGAIRGLRRGSHGTTANAKESKTLSDWCYSICAHVQKRKTESLHDGS